MNRFLRADDIRPADTWALVEWCGESGATEFSISLLGLQGEPTPYCDELERSLRPFQLADAPRPQTTWLVGAESVQPTPLWRLTAESVAILAQYLDEGLFTYPAGEWRTGCIEDPTIYRDAQIMLGVVSHEREAILTIRADENTALRRLNITFHEEPEWI